MRVLLIRTSALGDVVNCLPALTALRRHLPDATVGWVVEEAMAPVLAGHPGIDELIGVALRPWRRRPLAAATVREVRAFVARLRGFRADVALDLMGNHKAGVIARLSGAPRRIGLERRHRREPSSAAWLTEGVAPLGRHAVERALSPLVGLGVPVRTAEAAVYRGELLFPGAAPRDEGEPYILIHPGAAWGNKRYPPEWWGRVAALLEDAPGVACRVAWGPGEEGLADAVAAAGGARTLRLDAPGLAGLASAVRGARLVLAGDTGPLHLARALGAPVLALHGPTDPALHGPWRRPEAALWHRLPCSFCHRRMGSTKACLLALEPAAVAARARRLLAPPPGAGRRAPFP